MIPLAVAAVGLLLFTLLAPGWQTRHKRRDQATGRPGGAASAASAAARPGLFDATLTASRRAGATDVGCRRPARWDR